MFGGPSRNLESYLVPVGKIQREGSVADETRLEE